MELEQVLNISIEFFSVENYFAAAVALRVNQVDLVWAGPSEYIVIYARTNAKSIVEVTYPEYDTIIFIRADSNIQALTDLKGKTSDVCKDDSTGSHLGAIQLITDAGLDPQSDVKLIMSGEYSLKPLQTGQADAMTRTPYWYAKALQEASAAEDDYPIIARGKALLSDVFVVTSSMEPARQAKNRSRIL